MGVEVLLTGKEYSSTWTCEMLRLMRCAHVFDVGECKVKHSDLNEARERCSNDLSHEHSAGRDLWLLAGYSTDDAWLDFAPSYNGRI